jgi:hypothetical protein
MSHTETEPPTVEDDPTPPPAGDARTEFTDGSGAVVPEFVDASDSSAAARASTREYECLGCGRRCETFLDDCPDCGETAFSTAVETPDTASITDAGVGVLAVLVVRFHPLVPR